MSKVPTRQLDVLFIEPDCAGVAYQDLSKVYSAIETPTWSLLLAQSCRAKGYGVGILDQTAERLTDEQALKKIGQAKPRLAVFVVYGQNPNSGTTNMIGAGRLCAALKLAHPEIKTCFVGSHTSALPREVLSLPFVDFVLLNEGVYALHNLLATNLQDKIHAVKGLGHKSGGQLVLNEPQAVVPQERMDQDLPGYAWDLLPYDKKPLDLYRAHFWHAEFSHEKRTPFAAIYTSLGCRFACDFCMINIVNRVDNADGVVSANSRNMRYWSPDFITKEFEKLAGYGVETIRISDEMFFLDKRYYEPLCQNIIDRGLKFRMWSYSRVDTVRKEFLELFRKAGIGWLALEVRDQGLNVISNYIFGFPDDNLETMQQTLDLALELCTEMVNMYPCQALPGSPLYNTARQMGWKLPDKPEGFAFLSYESLPLPTKHVSAAEVLRFRDHAWQTYFQYPAFLELVEKKFGTQERKNVEAMASIRLRRRLLEEQPTTA
ncbi:MAG: B12-binding domain-containing radical SAM protein [Verrucomicrobia bacterium]|nr:B12-binding domain-containing radical SAM protein [Verrucomicrobiota bacterium]